MRFKCSCCRATLGKFCPKVGGDGDFTGGPWYVDENRLNHNAFICLHCGTIHDAVGSVTRTLGFILSFGNSMPMKVVGTMNPMELGMILMNDEHYGVESAREIVVRELGLKPRWIDVMLDRKVLGHAFEK
jgi:hypothetical protein